MTHIELDGRESLSMAVRRNESETGEVTLVITTADGTVQIAVGRTEDDATTLLDTLSKAGVQTTALIRNWVDLPDEHDGYVTLDRGTYYVTLGNREPGNQPDCGYPDVRVAIYELARLMTEAGEFPAAWAQGEHGPTTREINEEVRAFHDAGGTGLKPLEGVVYADGDEVMYEGHVWEVRRDYGRDLGVTLCEYEGRDLLVAHDRVTPVAAQG